MIGPLVGTQRILDILNGVIGIVERVDMLTKIRGCSNSHAGTTFSVLYRHRQSVIVIDAPKEVPWGRGDPMPGRKTRRTHRCYKDLGMAGMTICRLEWRPVKGQGLPISLRWNERRRRFAALFQHPHVLQGQVRHPAVF